MDYQSRIIEMISRMDEQDPSLGRLYHTVKKAARNHHPGYRSIDIAPPTRSKNEKPQKP